MGMKQESLVYHLPAGSVGVDVDPIVSHPRFRELCYKAYDKENSISEPYLRQSDRVSLLITSGRIHIHEDAEDLPPFSYHLIVANDGYIAKGPKQPYKDYRMQLPGSVVILNIHEPHHVVRDVRMCRQVENHPYPVWASLCFNTSDPDMPYQEITSRFNSGVRFISGLMSKQL